MTKCSLIFLVFLSFSPRGAFADSPSVGMISVDNHKLQPASGKRESSSFRPISSWVGESFVFLPKQTALQRFGYRDFQVGDELYESPNYNEYVGRIATVVSVQKVCDSWDVQFEMQDNGQRVTAAAWRGGIDGVAPVADIDAARDRWLGKTLWYKKTWIDTYNEDTGEVCSVHLRKNSQVKVIDIGAGWKHSTPVRFILQTAAGKQGYVDMTWTGTNCDDYERRYCDTFESLFFAQAPTSPAGLSKNREPQNVHHLQTATYGTGASQGG